MSTKWSFLASFVLLVSFEVSSAIHLPPIQIGIGIPGHEPGALGTPVRKVSVNKDDSDDTLTRPAMPERDSVHTHHESYALGTPVHGVTVSKDDDNGMSERDVARTHNDKEKLHHVHKKVIKQNDPPPGAGGVLFGSHQIVCDPVPPPCNNPCPPPAQCCPPPSLCPGSGNGMGKQNEAHVARLALAIQQLTAVIKDHKSVSQIEHMPNKH
ncbi:hypothetical protein JCGZ_21429 [Jatropha curcas]|uniref:Uncharacterized protein n=1 Tax=Jatropha curcas TaxID=180498 RepID=A0A067JDW7_JATCU|nr:hypothetical protein JCGZ_21429 [Jatropha curcas]